MHAAYLDLFNRFRNYVCVHGRPHIGANGGQLTFPWEMDEQLKSENMQKRAVFYVYDNILRTIKAGRWRERRYAD